MRQSFTAPWMSDRPLVLTYISLRRYLSDGLPERSVGGEKIEGQFERETVLIHEV